MRAPFKEGAESNISEVEPSMVQRSLKPTSSSLPPAPRTGSSAPASTPEPSRRDRLKAAAEHDRAAMLAEFNGTYELAREHREAAERLRSAATGTDEP